MNKKGKYREKDNNKKDNKKDNDKDQNREKDNNKGKVKNIKIVKSVMTVRNESSRNIIDISVVKSSHSSEHNNMTVNIKDYIANIVTTKRNANVLNKGSNMRDTNINK